MDPNSETTSGYMKLVSHIRQHVADFALWVLRLLTVLIVIQYILPFFWGSYTLYYKAFLCYLGISSLRLYQRVPNITLSMVFFGELLMEDSFHYVIYSVIFYSIPPVTLALLPIFLFSLLHLASYSIVLLDTLGTNSFNGLRFLISIVELLSRNILTVIAFTEIFLMPFTVVLTYMGRATLLTPILYYIFLTRRYLSARNPYTRNLFHDLRLVVDKTANRPEMPGILRTLLLTGVKLVCQLAPSTVQQPRQQ